MRKLAILSLALFAAACGSSSDPATPVGYIRVANLAPDAPAVDFCIAPAGGVDSLPVMAAKNATSGLVYDIPASSPTAGTKQMSGYFAYAAGTYTIKIFLKAPGGSCADPLVTATNVVVPAGGYKTIALQGYVSPAGLTPHIASVFTDEVSVATTSVALRFVNGGLLKNGSTVIATPAIDIGFVAGDVYTRLFANLAYPGVATAVAGGVDANGYLTIPSGGLPSSLALTVCPAGVTPAPGAPCQTKPVPPGSVSGGIVASGYIVGLTDVTNPTAPDVSAAGALFCGDVVSGTTIVPATGNYSACTSSL